MEIYVKIFFFWFSHMIFTDAFILPVSA